MKKSIKITGEGHYEVVIATVHPSGTVAITERQWDKAVDRLIAKGVNPNKIDNPDDLGLVITSNAKQILPPEDRDKIPVQIRLTQQEYDMVLSQSASKGLKIAPYLRFLIYEHSK